MGNILKNNYDNDAKIIIKELTEARDQIISIKNYLIPGPVFFRFKKEKEEVEEIRINLISLQLKIDRLRDKIKTN